MTTLLARMTGHPLLGAIVTEVIQFSSVTTILVVGFVSAGLMTLAQSIDVIFGANMGPTHSDRADRVKRGHYLIFKCPLATLKELDPRPLDESVRSLHK